MKCTLCNRINDVEIHSATLVDESGGRYLEVCGECKERLLQPRCCICGNRIVGWSKASDICFHTDDVEEYEDVELLYCDDCRSSLFEPPIGGIQGGFSVGIYTSKLDDTPDDNEEQVTNEINYQNGSQGEQHYYK